MFVCPPHNNQSGSCQSIEHPSCEAEEIYQTLNITRNYHDYSYDGL